MSDTVVVVPCYNEARRLDAAAFRTYLDAPQSADLLLVNDGSTDGTKELLDRLERERPGQSSVLHLARNQGKAEAVRQGIAQALARQPQFVGYWDADLATPLNVIARLRDELLARPAAMMAMGSRVRLVGRHIERSALRHYIGRCFATAASLTLGIPVYDTQCGAKLFRATSPVAQAFAAPFQSRWIFDVEIIERLCRWSRRQRVDPAELICEVPLDEWRDVRGSKIRAWDGIPVGWHLLAICWRRWFPPKTTPAVETADANAASAPSRARETPLY